MTDCEQDARYGLLTTESTERTEKLSVVGAVQDESICPIVPFPSTRQFGRAGDEQRDSSLHANRDDFIQEAFFGSAQESDEVCILGGFLQKPRGGYQSPEA
jgi:hypothetical protein